MSGVSLMEFCYFAGPLFQVVQLACPVKGPAQEEWPVKSQPIQSC